jgi:hypothetical protein
LLNFRFNFKQLIFFHKKEPPTFSQSDQDAPNQHFTHLVSTQPLTVPVNDSNIKVYYDNQNQQNYRTEHTNADLVNVVEGKDLTLGKVF